MKNLLLTGRPGVGKTTLIQRFLEVSGVPAEGFFTAEIREGGQRTGFAIRSLRGEEGILASVALGGPARVGKYGVDVAEVERVGVAAIRRGLESGALIVIDEIGKMELYSPTFQEAVWQALESACPVLGTITQSDHPFARRVRARDDVQVVTVTPANRERLLAEVLLPWHDRYARLGSGERQAEGSGSS
ncbi:MAG: NTPase [candidate division KSB1 bacterium]|nr:NTPase [candidate division KSB1 bacterium]